MDEDVYSEARRAMEQMLLQISDDPEKLLQQTENLTPPNWILIDQVIQTYEMKNA